MNLRISYEIKVNDYKSSDVEALVQFLNDRQIYKQTLSIPWPYTKHDGKRWLARVRKTAKNEGRSLSWAIRQGRSLIGGIGFLDMNLGRSHRAEIGYWLARPYWNKGIMTKVLPRVVEFAFEQLGLVKVTANVFSFNKASEKVLIKAGFKLEGNLKRHYYKDNEYFDGKVYATLKRL